MKGKNHKTQVKKREIKFDSIVGPDGWTLDYDKVVKRFNLKRDGALEYSHFDSVACQSIALTRFGVDMSGKKEE